MCFLVFRKVRLPQIILVACVSYMIITLLFHNGIDEKSIIQQLLFYAGLVVVSLICYKLYRRNRRKFAFYIEANYIDRFMFDFAYQYGPYLDDANTIAGSADVISLIEKKKSNGQ